MLKKNSRQAFPLFQTAIDLSHALWKNLLTPESLVIDATCGHGHDTLFLAELIDEGSLIAIDCQQEAIESSKKKILESSKKLGQITFYHQCHSSFPATIKLESVSLIVYNLGYLPSGNKELTTLRETTLKSIENALLLICPGGVISLTCYPGHEEGKLEEEMILNFAKKLNPLNWSCCLHRFINRNNSPSLLIIQRAF